MGDLVFVAIIIAFFFLSALYVTWCDRIIGPDDFGTATEDDSADELSIVGLNSHEAEVMV